MRGNPKQKCDNKLALTVKIFAQQLSGTGKLASSAEVAVYHLPPSLQASERSSSSSSLLSWWQERLLSLAQMNWIGSWLQSQDQMLQKCQPATEAKLRMSVRLKKKSKTQHSHRIIFIIFFSLIFTSAVCSFDENLCKQQQQRPHRPRQQQHATLIQY